MSLNSCFSETWVPPPTRDIPNSTVSLRASGSKQYRVPLCSRAAVVAWCSPVIGELHFSFDKQDCLVGGGRGVGGGWRAAF